MKRKITFLTIVLTFIFLISSFTTVSAVTELDFWIIESFVQDDDAAIYTAIEMFEEEYPDIKINVTAQPPQEIKNTYITATFGGGGPDIATLDSGWQAELAQLDLVADISDKYVEIKDRFLEGPANTGEVFGNYYSAPWYTNNVAFFYNMDLLREVGIEEAPSDWDELLDMAIKVTEQTDAYGLTMGGADFMTFTALPFLYTAEGRLADEDGPKFHEEAGIEAFGFATDLYVKHGVMSEGAITAAHWGEVFAPFLHGNAAALVSGDWAIGSIQGADVDFEWEIAKVPAHPVTGNRGTVIGGYNFNISSNTEHVEEAWKFIEFITREDMMWVLEEYNRISALKAHIDSEYAKEDPLQTVFFEQGDIGVPRARVPQIEAIQDILEEYLEEVMYGNMDIEEALQAAADQALRDLW